MTAKQKKAKIRKVMEKYKSGKLKSSSGDEVKSSKQALAIALSEAGMSNKAKEDMSEEYYMSYMDQLSTDGCGEDDVEMDATAAEKRCKGYLKTLNKSRRKNK